jgi:tRNA-specific 2-thiouridylase
MSLAGLSHKAGINNMVKAISLISGGLDSTLATKVVLDQGIDVIAVNFISPFCQCNKKDGCRHEAQFVSVELKIPLRVINVTHDFLEVLKSPRHGYGSHMNPCLDCRILMLKKAKELMKETEASFLVTGEVLGQRPMSQRREAMRQIEKEAGVLGLVLRPLSAKLLEPTIAETEGWVDRQRLLDISGRSRKPQMKMAQDYNIKDYPCPAGGCLLTDPAFSRRVKDLIDHHELTLEDIHLLKHGRYFRISERAKLIVGRNEHDNNILESLASEDDLIFCPQDDVSGASGLGRGGFSPEKILLASRIVSRYFDPSTQDLSPLGGVFALGSAGISVELHKNKEAGHARVIVKHQGRVDIIEGMPFSDEEVKRYLI